MQEGLSVVIPAYSEETTITGVVKDVAEALKNVPQKELLILNDGSTDATGPILQKLCGEVPELRVITNPTNRGICDAFEKLYHQAKLPWIVSFPADGECHAGDILRLYESRNNHDLVIGNRGLWKHRSLARNLISYFYRQLTKLFFGVETYDPGSIKLLKREIIDKIPIKSTSVFNEAERVILAKRCGYKIGAIPVSYFPKIKKSQRWEALPEIIHSLRDLIALRFRLWRSQKIG